MIFYSEITSIFFHIVYDRGLQRFIKEKMKTKGLYAMVLFYLLYSICFTNIHNLKPQPILHSSLFNTCWYVSNKVHLCVIVHLRIEYKHTHSPCDPRSHHESLRAMRLKRATLTTKERVSREKSPSLSLSAALWNELITPPHTSLPNIKVMIFGN